MAQEININAIISNNKITSSVKLVWLALLTRENKQFTYQEIAEECSISRKTVYRACDILRSLNLYDVKTRQGGTSEIEYSS